jgi:hypothetical protein
VEGLERLVSIPIQPDVLPFMQYVVLDICSKKLYEGGSEALSLTLESISKRYITLPSYLRSDLLRSLGIGGV